jgi:hypothetical protein
MLVKKTANLDSIAAEVRKNVLSDIVRQIK